MSNSGSGGATVRNGIDRLSECLRPGPRLKNIGLVSNSKALTCGGRVNLHALREAGFAVRFIFSPEHGYYADVRDGDYISDSEHPELKTPIFSLFTEGHSRNAIEEALAGGAADAVVFDIQDAGVRFYTYIHALGLTLSAAATLGIPAVVLDRVNPAGAAIVEGCLPEAEYFSELCPFSIPIRYGLTIGELARYLVGTLYPKTNLTVVKISDGYRRNMIFADTGLEWTPPSPAMVSPDTALFYPGTCLFEGTNLSEGRGTAAPFQIIGAPFLDAKKALGALNKNLDSLVPGEFDFITAEEAAFTPASSKHENLPCRGIRLGFRDGKPRPFRALLFGLILLKSVYDSCRGEFSFLFSEKSRRHFIDRLCGGAALRETLESGGPEAAYELYLKWAAAADEFSLSAAPARLYG